jgi:hypothetical protein
MTSQRFTINYRLTGTGWAECEVRAGAKTTTVTASYMNDALGQLATATLLLRMGAPAAQVSFEEEPGEYRWSFDWHRSTSGNVDSLRVRIWWFDKCWQSRPDDDVRELILDEIVESTSFYHGMRRMLDEVLSVYGEDQYKEMWGEPFPIGVQETLNALLDQWPGPS